MTETVTEEQTETTEETEAAPDPITQIAKGMVEMRDEKPSKEADDASKETKTKDTTDETATGTETPADATAEPRTLTEGSEEFNTVVDRLSQSKKDKELKPIQDELKAAKDKIIELESGGERKSEDDALTRLEAAEEGELGDAPEVLDIQTTRRKVIEMFREAEDKLAAATKTVGDLENAERDHQAWQAILPMLLPDDETAVANVNAMVARLQAATSPEHMADILVNIKRETADLETVRLAQEKEAKKPARKPEAPDSSSSSTTVTTEKPTDPVAQISAAIKEGRK